MHAHGCVQLDDMGNLAVFNRGPSSHLRPFDRDGARAVAALCAQVTKGCPVRVQGPVCASFEGPPGVCKRSGVAQCGQVM